jgi:hypothetical protein
MIFKAMARVPADRFATAEEFRAELDRAGERSAGAHAVAHRRRYDAGYRRRPSAGTRFEADDLDRRCRWAPS